MSTKPQAMKLAWCFISVVGYPSSNWTKNLLANATAGHCDRESCHIRWQPDAQTQYTDDFQLSNRQVRGEPLKIPWLIDCYSGLYYLVYWGS
jgi:hypothetical protein